MWGNRGEMKSFRVVDESWTGDNDDNADFSGDVRDAKPKIAARKACGWEGKGLFAWHTKLEGRRSDLCQAPERVYAVPEMPLPFPAITVQALSTYMSLPR